MRIELVSGAVKNNSFIGPMKHTVMANYRRIETLQMHGATTDGMVTKFRSEILESHNGTRSFFVEAGKYGFENGSSREVVVVDG